MEILQWISTNWLAVVTTTLSVIGGASVVLKAIAPWTKSSADDEAAKWMDKVVGWLSKVALNPKP